MSNNYIKIKENPNMVKDTKTGAIVANNVGAYNAFILKKKKRDMLLDHEKEIHSIKEDISEIKMLLKELLMNNKEDN